MKPTYTVRILYGGGVAFCLSMATFCPFRRGITVSYIAVQDVTPPPGTIYSKGLEGVWDRWAGAGG